MRLHATRKLSKNLTFQYLNASIRLPDGQRLPSAGRSSDRVRCVGGEVSVLHQGKRWISAFWPRASRRWPWTMKRAVATHRGGGQGAPARPARASKPSVDHPWNRMIRLGRCRSRQTQKRLDEEERGRAEAPAVPGLGSLCSLRPGTGQEAVQSLMLMQGNLKHSKGDISTLEKRGHLYIALTGTIRDCLIYKL